MTSTVIAYLASGALGVIAYLTGVGARDVWKRWRSRRAQIDQPPPPPRALDMSDPLIRRALREIDKIAPNMPLAITERAWKEQNRKKTPQEFFPLVTGAQGLTGGPVTGAQGSIGDAPQTRYEKWGNAPDDIIEWAERLIADDPMMHWIDPAARRASAVARVYAYKRIEHDAKLATQQALAARQAERGRPPLIPKHIAARYDGHHDAYIFPDGAKVPRPAVELYGWDVAILRARSTPS